MVNETQETDLALVDLLIEAEHLRAKLAILAPAINEANGTHYGENLRALRDEIGAVADDLHHLFSDNAIPYIHPKGYISGWLKVAMQENAAQDIPEEQLTHRDWEITRDELANDDDRWYHG